LGLREERFPIQMDAFDIEATRDSALSGDAESGL
jgi:hypothetical protein